MNSPVTRPIEPADFAAVHALKQTTFRHDNVPEAPTLQEVTEELERTNLATDTRLIEIDGTIVGYAFTFYLPSEKREERCYLNSEFDPSIRNSGHDDKLLRWAIARATEQLRSPGRSLPLYVRVDHYDFVTYAHRLYERVGFAPVRHSEQLLRPLTDLQKPHKPDGITIVPWEPKHSAEARLVSNEAFADHWGSTPASEERWREETEGFGVRLDLSWIALDDTTGTVVAFCLNSRYPDDDELVGRRDGWIARIGTLRSHRGRGLASTLINHSLQAFAADNLTNAVIGVDRENPSGAAELYRKLGFELHTTSITYQIEV